MAAYNATLVWDIHDLVAHANVCTLQMLLFLIQVGKLYRG